MTKLTTKTPLKVVKILKEKLNVLNLEKQFCIVVLNLYLISPIHIVSLLKMSFYSNISKNRRIYYVILYNNLNFLSCVTEAFARQKFLTFDSDIAYRFIAWTFLREIHK